MKYLFIAGLFLSMASVGLTIRCYTCIGCDTVTQSQLQDCSSTAFNALCSVVESSGHIARSCAASAAAIGCIEASVDGINATTCVCKTDGCNGPTALETTTFSGSGAPKANIVGSLIAVTIAKILL